MARYAMVNEQSGIVTVIVEWNGDLKRWQPPPLHKMVESDEAKPGWSYHDEQFKPPDEARR